MDPLMNAISGYKEEYPVLFDAQAKERVIAYLKARLEAGTLSWFLIQQRSEIAQWIIQGTGVVPPSGMLVGAACAHFRLEVYEANKAIFEKVIDG